MNEFYLFLKAYIEAECPEFKTVRMWRNQFVRANDKRDEKSFRLPAIFIEFIHIETANYSTHRDVDYELKFHMGFGNYQLEKNDDLIIRDKFEGAMTGLRGGENDTAHFTTLQKSFNSDEADDDNTDLQVSSFITKYRDLTGIKPTAESVPPTTLDLTAEIKS
jgi:hypothetical protein